jgi:hypothetical protein
MGLYYRLDYKNNKNYLNHKDSVPDIKTTPIRVLWKSLV